MRMFARLALAGLLALAASGIARAEDALKAKIGVLRLSSSAPVFIAQDKGYFREAGLDIELKFFDAAQPIAVATTSGDVDFGITAFTAGLYNLAGKGTLKVIGGMSREKAGYPLIGYFAGNMHWAVRFQGAELHILLHGPAEAYLERLDPLLSGGRIARVQP